MYPTLFRFAGFGVPTHAFFVLAGVAAALLVFRRESRLRGEASPAMWTIAAGALIGGALLAKASTTWRFVAEGGEATITAILLHGGKSVVGGLAGAYAGAVITKRLIGYRRKTGDVFAPAVALGIATGRIGCFLTEQIGTPTSLPWGFVPPADVAAGIPYCPQCTTGVPLHPSFLYEIAFCLLMYALLTWMRDRIPVPGESFKVFLLGYGIFRFAVEFVRGNEVMALGLTGTQLFLAATLPILLGYFVRQLRSGAYRTTAAASTPIGSAP
ncbi:MAG TPA: prolipoprotein diacylglyceryl transferase family protein [Acidimicrobiia bacterium]|nr:prolipoprotein diacylglyceryl transferase family protein [Acidimicrobiia bacterium]